MVRCTAVSLDGVPEEIFDGDYIETKPIDTAKVIIDVLYLTDCSRFMEEPAINRAPTEPIPDTELKRLKALSLRIR